MADKIYLKGVFGFREDTLENWETSNTVLEKGEIALISNAQNEKWLKVGDGETPWKELSWKTGPKGEDCVLTGADKTDIANIVLSNFTDVSEVGQ